MFDSAKIEPGGSRARLKTQVERGAVCRHAENRVRFEILAVTSFIVRLIIIHD